ncbi:MAG TPA: ABC transporter substrate-binding protein [Gaiellaceae bacterium]|jgi:polar amino acid transport system substrate-binding protein|nr:ABC transporter substrate-binding protein [Gaiellaceae bacterium]
MRKLLPLTLLAALAATAAFTASASSHPSKVSCGAATVSKGTLTIGTDNPAYPPWYGGNPGHGWKISDPYSGKGYESAVAYAVAKQLGYSHAKVKWVYVPFDKSFAPGKKNFDFDITQISYTPQRAKVVTFSNSYYDVNQALVVRNGTPIAKAKSITALRPYTLGAQLGTTSYQFIKAVIRPANVKVYNSNDKAVFALKSKLIDGVVVDLPTAFYVTAVQVPNSKILGQFGSKTGEHFGMVFQKGNPLAGCVNKALAAMKANGTLKQINDTWLSKVVSVPVLT